MSDTTYSWERDEAPLKSTTIEVGPQPIARMSLTAHKPYDGRVALTFYENGNAICQMYVDNITFRDWLRGTLAMTGGE